MNRRKALQIIGGSFAVAALNTKSVRSAAPVKPKRLGLVVYCCRFRREKYRRENPHVDLFEPSRFLDHCQKLGAGGMQVSLGVLDSSAARALRRKAEEAKMFIEAIISPPKEKKDLEAFEAQVKTAAEVGAKAARTVIIPGRRYEFFDSLEKFLEFDARGRRSLELAAPIVEKHRVSLAVENHKDHRNDERVALFEHISSEYVGACVDTGNSVALLEDPIETVEALAPWAHSVHLKDQAVQSYRDGFLLDDIPLSQGFLNLKKMVEILRRKKPTVEFNLELITRDPLKVPVLRNEYWATFPNLPGKDLARTLRAVRDGAAEKLQYVSDLSLDEQLTLEDANIRQSLDYARDQLGL